MKTLKRTHPAVSPITQAANDNRQLREQNERLKTYLADTEADRDGWKAEAARMSISPTELARARDKARCLFHKANDARHQYKRDLTSYAANVVQLTAELATEQAARAQADEDAERLRAELTTEKEHAAYWKSEYQGAIAVMAIAQENVDDTYNDLLAERNTLREAVEGMAKEFDCALHLFFTANEAKRQAREQVREAHTLIQSQGEMAIESGALSAALETAENDALALATGIREQRDIVGYWLMDEEHDSQALEEGILPRLCDTFGKLMTAHGAKYIERDAALRQQIAESAANRTPEQYEAALEKLRAAVAEAWIGEGERANPKPTQTQRPSRENSYSPAIGSACIPVSATT